MPGVWEVLKKCQPLFTTVGEEKQCSFHPSDFLAENPVIKDRLTREK